MPASKGHRLPALLLMLGLLPGCSAADEEEGTEGGGEVRQYTFSWPFSESDQMQPRGGTTRGPEVELLRGTSEAWDALREPDLSKLERDRRAILAMAGGYRTTFDFIETAGFVEGYEPAQPYQSWATEYIFVVDDTGDAITLQHIIVMLFVGEDGEVQGPVVQKHWRQDWRYEDRDLHTFAGHRRWTHEERPAEAVEGKWSQAVWQVDDSPRYEALGEWEHTENHSAWTSEETWRPLPRRESSVRDDYNVLIGTNRHAITPTGWVQEEDNLKVELDEDGEPVQVLAREAGVNRYERIVDFDFSPAEAYWERTSAFWSDVREAWREVFSRRERIQLAEDVDGRALFEHMFAYAQALNEGEPYDQEDSRRFVRQTLERYLD